MTRTRTGIRFPAGIDRATFLRDYWQKRPLLMRAALPPTLFTVAPDELAGLACEEACESRIVAERGPGDWILRHGPFAEDDFAALPEQRWTLLVQDVDKWLPEVGALIDHFDFVPAWRIDDIMISYAADQGGVGPHSDAYDVFLMQAWGRRRWRLSYREYSDADLLPDLDLRILSRFETDDEWLLEPGDILYLPPGVAHWGIAEGECMTYSLGFRSPNRRELAGGWFQHLIDLADDRHLHDGSDLQVDDLGRLTDGGIAQAAQLVAALPDTRSTTFRLWLGRYLTETKPQFQILPPDQSWSDADLTAWIRARRALERHPAARLAWLPLAEDGLALFCQGEVLRVDTSAEPGLRLLSMRRHIDAETLGELAANPSVRAVLLQLLNDGVLEPGEVSA